MVEVVFYSFSEQNLFTDWVLTPFNDLNYQLSLKFVNKFNTTYVKIPQIDYSNKSVPFDAPLILEWNAFTVGSTFGKEATYRNECPFKCVYTNDRRLETLADVITFNFGKYNDIAKSRNPDRIHAFLNFESPNNQPKYKSVPKDYFNLTVTYRLDSDIPLLYDYFIPIRNVSKAWDQKKVDEAVNKKTKPALFMVSHCKTSSKRETLVAEMQKYINVTQIGRCNKNYCLEHKECEKENIESHYFTIAFENSDCIDYVTEKVYRLRNLIVPVILDRSILRGIHAKLNPYVIAASDFNSTKSLTDYLKFLMKNKKEYKKYLEWTKFYEKAPNEDILDGVACKLCEVAWQKKAGVRKIIADIQEWWGNNKCRAYFGELYVKSRNASLIPLIYDKI